MNNSLAKRSVSAIAVGKATRGELPKYVTAQEVARARAILDGLTHSTDHKRLRNAQARALLGLLWSTGVRISEALALRQRDVDVHHRVVTVRTLKRRTEVYRTLPVPSEYFTELLEIAMLDGLNRDSRLFPWGRTMAHNIVQSDLVAAGVELGRATPKALRHGHAMHALHHNVPLDIIQRQLGHSTILTTSHYLRATAADVRRAYEGVKW